MIRPLSTIKFRPLSPRDATPLSVANTQMSKDQLLTQHGLNPASDLPPRQTSPLRQTGIGQVSPSRVDRLMVSPPTESGTNVVQLPPRVPTTPVRAPNTPLRSQVSVPTTPVRAPNPPTPQRSVGNPPPSVRRTPQRAPPTPQRTVPVEGIPQPQREYVPPPHIEPETHVHGDNCDHGPQQPQYEEVSTDYGTYMIPRYDLMSEEDQAIHRETISMTIRLLNTKWRCYGINLEPLSPDESLKVATIRCRQTCRFISAKCGAVYWKVALIFAWGLFELVCCKLKIPASGYTKSQLMMYEIYEAYLIEMGEISGIGEGWSPITKILVISLIHAVVFIGLCYILGLNGNDQATSQTMGSVSKFLAGFVVGGTETVRVDESTGVPEGAAAIPNMNVGGFDVGQLLAGGGNMIGDLIGRFTSNMQQPAQPNQPTNQPQPAPASRAAARAARASANTGGRT